MAKFLYYDASAGISGDMNLAALVGLGVDFEYLCNELKKLNLNDEFKLSKKEVLKSNISALKIDVEPLKINFKPRNFNQICALINASNLSEFVKDRSIAIFSTLARAEAKIHNTSINNVHFHEVGAIDSIVDIVGAAICFEALGKPEIYISKIELGGGFARSSHGILSVPAPATIEILKGFNLSMGRADFEMTTPTGAAILKSLALNFAPPSEFKILNASYGAGSKEIKSFANALRVMLCETSNLNLSAQKLIQTNIDDMDAEGFAFACEVLLNAGALDVFSHSIYMKKGRIGFELNVLCNLGDCARLKELIFRHTSAIGVREIDIIKTELKREFCEVLTKFGKIKLKISCINKNQTRLKPEFNDCKELAKAHNITLNEVKSEALKIYDKTQKSR